ncbi:very short patch repair endonuclease [Arthrobacter sp. EH-1B-1]|uniref:Very short patch repair endonuclease n=1 Tax=Arthrobacter vasquezii TaxID=2977629 RepID=A0ABT6CQ50_9MICC|nr:very short patch repair endonuclease [Arthrobacter vasquezii]MDF9276249.1 very short patch repair endonuclease [Arthrobacter vasquezii]
MADFMTSAQRSAHMAKIRSKDTKPELQVRRALHADGYRYRLHDRSLPGRPDLVFPGRKKVIFVNGCFWHGHDCPVGSRLPKSNTAFWSDKRRRNQERDSKQRTQLEELGWNHLDVWECEVRANPVLLAQIEAFLGEVRDNFSAQRREPL